jgi:altronate dehydratase small subunit
MAENQKAILMNLQDNVAVVLSQVNKNERVTIIYDNKVIDSIQSKDNIEIYHKIAIKFINSRENVYKYGEIIGRAVEPIEKGHHVHVTNIKGVTMKK